MATILLTLDGSNFSEQALPHALGLLKPGDELLLLQTVEPVATIMRPETLVTHVDMSAFQAYLDKLVARLEERGVTARSILATGPARETIVAVAAREKASLLVMSSHGRTGLKRWLLGSVAESVARQAPCPVWLVRCCQPEELALNEPWKATAPAISRVLLPLDISERADRAVEFITGLLARNSVTLILLAATNMSFIGHTDAAAEVVKEVRQALEERAARLRGEGWTVEVVVDPETPAEAILDHAAARKVDLIAMSSHGRTGAERWLMGSVAEKVVRHAECPVAIVRVAP